MRKMLCTVMLSIALALPGCMDNDVSIYISNVIMAQLEENRDNPGTYLCTFESGFSPWCQRGKLDLVGTNWGSPQLPTTSPALMLALVVGNRLPANNNIDRGEINTHHVRINRIEMRFQWTNRDVIEQNAALTPLLGLEEEDVVSVGYYAENLVPSASESGEPSEAMMFDITVIPPEVGLFLQSVMGGMQDSELSQVVLGCQLRLIGRTNGNRHVESDDFFFPVGFCNDCVREGFGCYLNQTPYSLECVTIK